MKSWHRAAPKGRPKYSEILISPMEAISPKFKFPSTCCRGSAPEKLKLKGWWYIYFPCFVILLVFDLPVPALFSQTVLCPHKSLQFNEKFRQNNKRWMEVLLICRRLCLVVFDSIQYTAKIALSAVDFNIELFISSKVRYLCYHHFMQK